jgi:hypothetical protein
MLNFRGLRKGQLARHIVTSGVYFKPETFRAETPFPPVGDLTDKMKRIENECDIIELRKVFYMFFKTKQNNLMDRLI